MEQNASWLGQNFPFNVKVNETAYFCKWLYNFAPLLSQTLVVVIHYLYSLYTQTQHSGGGDFMINTSLSMYSSLWKTL
jgi:hypothetical protein